MPVRWVVKSFRFYLARILGEHKENDRITKNSSKHFAESVIWEENKLTRVLVKRCDNSKTAKTFEQQDVRGKERKPPKNEGQLISQSTRISLKLQAVPVAIAALLHSFSNKNIVFSAEVEYSYFTVDTDIFLWIFLEIIAYDISVFECIWCLDDVKVILEPPEGIKAWHMRSWSF